MFWVYILENPRGTFYIGQTENLSIRLADHNRLDGFDGHFTRKNGPWKLVWKEQHSSRGSAMLRRASNQADEICQMDSQAFVDSTFGGC